MRWPDLEADAKLWVSKCLACLKGRARPTKVEARAVKRSAETCWQEVSVDCEGLNREDRDGYRYSLTDFDCLSHAVLLEPLKSLTHSEVRRAFTRCVLRSRTLPALVRSDRGPDPEAPKGVKIGPVTRKFTFTPKIYTKFRCKCKCKKYTRV